MGKHLGLLIHFIRSVLDSLWRDSAPPCPPRCRECFPGEKLPSARHSFTRLFLLLDSHYKFNTYLKLNSLNEDYVVGYRDRKTEYFFTQIRNRASSTPIPEYSAGRRRAGWKCWNRNISSCMHTSIRRLRSNLKVQHHEIRVYFLFAIHVKIRSRSTEHGKFPIPPINVQDLQNRVDIRVTIQMCLYTSLRAPSS